MSLCFDEAYQALKTNRISEKEYLHEVLAHFIGVRHPADEKLVRPWELMISDPVGNAIRDAALSSPKSRPECTISRCFNGYIGLQYYRLISAGATIRKRSPRRRYCSRSNCGKASSRRHQPITHTGHRNICRPS